MEADRNVGWAIQKPIPSFRTQSLRTATGLPPWDPIAIKVSQILPGWQLHSPTKAYKKAQSCILNGF